MAGHGNTFDGSDFLLPDLGEGLEEAEVVEWLVEAGTEVEEGTPLALVETGKAQTEVMAPKAGVIELLKAEVGDKIAVGSAFVTYGGGEAASEAAPESEANEEPAEEQAEAAEEGDAGSVVGALSEAAAGDPGKPLATPAVRKQARDKGVDLRDVAGTGVGGRVTLADVEAAAERYRTSQKPRPVQKSTPAARGNGKPAAPEAEPRPTIGFGEDDAIHVPLRGLRRTIADRLRESVDRAVHFTVMDEADVTALEAARKRLVAATGTKISLLPFVCAAVARVLAGEAGQDLTRLNSTVNDDMTDITRHKSVHLGIAVDTADGLMVPVLRDARKLGVMELG
ncbi:MAG: dihydrolipoamide acetyltransferase family protein, partial [Planctomycetota bacterium]